MFLEANRWYWDSIRTETPADIRRCIKLGDCRGWVLDWYWFRGLLTQTEVRELHRLTEGRAVLGGTR